MPADPEKPQMNSAFVSYASTTYPYMSDLGEHHMGQYIQIGGSPRMERLNMDENRFNSGTGFDPYYIHRLYSSA